MEIKKTYSPKEVENKWYSYWMDNRFFAAKPNPNKEPYTIVIPPPNVTGVLHMGHMLNNTIQDVLIRKARMEGKEACWIAGTDHASIATETKVVAMLREKGIKKSDLSREDFLKYAWEWKEKYGGIILEQLKKLGASCDWDRTRFTMEPEMSDAVIEVFIKLYRDGLIYRGNRMVNWDPQGKTALSDEEVIHKEVNSKLYYLKYQIDGSEDYITVATTRPETILGDTAICVNPKDQRYQHLKGKKAIVPLIGRKIPVIMDEYVDMEFGTGCLKVTPAHDVNDYALGQKHGLEIIDIMNDDGTFSANAQLYIGEDRFKVRKLISKELEEKAFLLKTEDIKNSVGYSERTDAVIEPRLSLQWFVDMKKFLEKKPEALSSVMNDEIQLIPSKFKNTYRHWMENIKDWCISRQLWWGQRIPAYYLINNPSAEPVVAFTEQEAVELFQKNYPGTKASDIRQDEDVLDTWFSSWLWPISVFDGFKDPQNKDINYFYPTNDLVTAPEILFFWVARMIMAGYMFRGEIPFKKVYLTGIVRDKQGRKMSKSLGNSPDPLDLIEEYGADGIRVGMLLSSPAGNDLLYDEKLCLQGRNFTNKIYNAYNLISGWQIKEGNNVDNIAAIQWMESKFSAALIELEDNFSKYRLSDALMSVYKLVWDDFCSNYLEMIKPGFKQPIDRETYSKTIDIFEKLLKVIHPFTPFISEEYWHKIKERSQNECIIVAEWPKASQTIDKQSIEHGDLAIEIVSNIRNIRNAKQIAKFDPLKLYVKNVPAELISNFSPVIKKLACIESIETTQQPIDGASTFIIRSNEFYIPVGGSIDVEKEKENLLKQLEHKKGFLASVEKKLSNEKFVTGAPAPVLELERKKKADAEAEIQALEKSLANL